MALALRINMVDALAIEFDGTANMVNRFTDPSATSIDSIVSCNRGYATVHQTSGGANANSFTLDLFGDAATTDVTVVYTRTRSGVVEEITATITVAAPAFPNAFIQQEPYVPPLDADGNPVVRPGRNTRVVLYAENGLTAADIALAEGISETAVTGNWLRDNLVSGETYHYGEHDDHALNQDLAVTLFKTLRVDGASPWFMAKRGSSFPVGAFDPTRSTPSNIGNVIGESPMHPIYVGAYGAGAKPYFNGSGFKVQNAKYAVVGDYSSYEASALANGNNNICLYGVIADFRDGTDNEGVSGFNVDGSNTFARHVSVLNCWGYKTSMKSGYVAATKQPVWNNGQRKSFIHPGRSGHVIWLNLFSMESACDLDYFADGRLTGPQRGSNQSHFIYQPIGAYGHIFANALSIAAAGSTMQFRSSGWIQNMVGMLSNTGINPGRGANDVNDVLGLADPAAGEFAFVSNYWQTEMGFKGWYDSGAYDNKQGILAGGINYRNPHTSLVNSGAINGGEGRLYSAFDDIGPGVSPTSGGGVPVGSGNYWPIQNNGGNLAPGSNFSYSNYNRDDFPDVVPSGAASQAERDAATVAAYAETITGVPGMTARQFGEWLVDNDPKPWRHAKGLADFWKTVMGMFVGVPTDNEWLDFRPNPAFSTPGFCAFAPDDWAQGYLPGESVGNKVNLSGHKDVVFWWTPPNDYAEFKYGAGGSARHIGGAIRSDLFTIDAGGNSHKMERAAEIYIPDHDQPGVWTLDATQALICIEGTVADKVDVTARTGSEFIIWEGSSFTNTETLTLYGDSFPGFDGTAGGAATLILDASGTIEFRPSLQIEIDGITLGSIEIDPPGSSDPDMNDFFWPKKGATITNGTATAVCREMLQTSNTSLRLWVDDIVGAFADDDVITCADTFYGPFQTGSRTIGNFNGTPAYTLPTYGPVMSGIDGFSGDGFTGAMVLRDTNAVGVVDLNGGGLLIDIGNVGNVTDHPLFENVTVNHNANFGSVTIENGGAKDVTIDVTATEILLTIVNGTGGVTVNYPA